MTLLLSVDPGKSTGIALGYYDAITPYLLLERWNVLGGLEGFIDWWDAAHYKDGPLSGGMHEHQYDLVVEQFRLDSRNEFTADLAPVQIEGAIVAKNGSTYCRPIVWQPRTDKAVLTGYPKDCVTKTQRQRHRFDFLERFGLFAAGSRNDDSNDAVCHALIFLKRAKHAPSLHAFWPQKLRLVP